MNWWRAIVTNADGDALFPNYFGREYLLQKLTCGGGGGDLLPDGRQLCNVVRPSIGLDVATASTARSNHNAAVDDTSRLELDQVASPVLHRTTGPQLLQPHPTDRQ